MSRPSSTVHQHFRRRLRITTALLAVASAAAVAITVSASGTATASPRATGSGAAASRGALAADVSAARLATTKYATDLRRAKADGYQIITRMIPNMGYHFLNAKVTGFDVRKPAILVYEHRGNSWQLGALEWVFTSMPTKSPLPGAKYGVFGAACHYADGTFVFQTDKSKCATRSPQTGAKFTFWHPRLITLHFWIWYPNASGIYSGLNPYVNAFNNG
jgi:hypothetical protein